MRHTERYRAVFEKEIKQAKVPSRVSRSYEIMGSLVPTFVVVFIVLAFVFRIATVNGKSMVPTLSSGDSLVISNAKATYNRGDIVVISQSHKGECNLIKRIVAVGGDTVDIDYKAGTVIVNGKKLKEPYTNSPSTLILNDYMKFPVTVPKGYVFVMGDNRNNSLDSRSKSIGFIDERYIYGKACFRLKPIKEWRIYNGK